MGALCSCGTGEKSSDNGVKPKPPVVSAPQKTNTSDLPRSNADIHSSDEILDDHLKTEITKAIDEYVTTLPSAYQTERDRIVNEMSRSAPASYLGLAYADYPDVNGGEVSKMARQLVSAKDVKHRLIDQIDQRVDSAFIARTSDWSASSRETARPIVRVYIEKQVNDAFNRAVFE